MDIPKSFRPDKDLTENINRLLRKTLTSSESQKDFKDRWSRPNFEFLLSEQCRDFLKDWINIFRPVLTSFALFRRATMGFMSMAITKEPKRIYSTTYYGTLGLLPDDLILILNRHKQFLDTFSQRGLNKIYSYPDLVDVRKLYSNIRKMSLKEFIRFRKMVRSVYRLVQDDQKWEDFRMHVPESINGGLDDRLFFGNPKSVPVSYIICEIVTGIGGGIVTVSLIGVQNPVVAVVLGYGTWATISSRMCIPLLKRKK